MKTSVVSHTQSRIEFFNISLFSIIFYWLIALPIAMRAKHKITDTKTLTKNHFGITQIIAACGNLAHDTYSMQSNMAWWPPQALRYLCCPLLRQILRYTIYYDPHEISPIFFLLAIKPALVYMSLSIIRKRKAASYNNTKSYYKMLLF